MTYGATILSFNLCDRILLISLNFVWKEIVLGKYCDPKAKRSVIALHQLTINKSATLSNWRSRVTNVAEFCFAIAAIIASGSFKRYC